MSEAVAYATPEEPFKFVPPDVSGAIREAKARTRAVYPCQNNRASAIGGDCLRALVYERTSWQQKLLPSVDLQFIFDGGKLIEPYAESMLRDAGFTVIEQQRFFDLKEDGETLLTGHLDNKIQVNGNSYPCEIKGYAGHTWDKLNSFSDLLESPLPYVRKAAVQILMYLHGTDSRHGLFLLISKQNWQPKDIWVDLEDHVVLIGNTLHKCRDINRHVRESTLPDFTEKTDLCKSCDFFHICAPPLEGSGSIEINPDLEEDLARWWELKEAKAEYEALDRRIKADVKEKTALIGPFQISGKWVDKKAFSVAASRYWQASIKRI